MPCLHDRGIKPNGLKNLHEVTSIKRKLLAKLSGPGLHLKLKNNCVGERLKLEVGTFFTFLCEKKYRLGCRDLGGYFFTTLAA